MHYIEGRRLYWRAPALSFDACRAKLHRKFLLVSVATHLPTIMDMIMLPMRMTILTIQDMLIPTAHIGRTRLISTATIMTISALPVAARYWESHLR